MSDYQIYSKRQRILRGEVPDVVQFDHLPTPLRVQIIHILNQALSGSKSAEKVYAEVNNTLCDEYGVFQLNRGRGARLDLHDLLECGTNKETTLDAIELLFRAIDQNLPTQRASDAVTKLNARFREHAVGYRFESGHIVRVDSQFLHTEVVQPVLVMLHDPKFQGANEEFLKAHEHYRHGRFKESLAECLKSFESTMKTICTLKKWHFQPTATAKELIGICIDKRLFPAFLDSELNSLRALLTSGVPTVRNKLGGHGQGAQKTSVSEELVSYALHLTAANILLLIEAHNRLP